MNKKEKNNNKSSWILMLCFMLIGMLCGILMVRYIDSAFESGVSLGKSLFTVAMLFVWMYIAIFIQIVVHELGHLIFGLLTGYQYSSFRIGSFMWVKENGRIRRKRFSIAGTGGQCLMLPPDLIDGKIPFVLYNLGGAIFNIIFSVLCLIGYCIFGNASVISMMLLILVIVGIAFALINGVPMHLGNVDNDGKNAWALGKNAEALYSFWLQLKVNEQITRGVRLKDMPEKWFRFPSADGMKNSMAVLLGVYSYSRFLDRHDFEEAKETIDRLLQTDSAITGLQRNMVVLDRIYLELIGDKNQQEIDRLFDKELKKFVKSMKRYSSVLRTEYTYALLFEKDKIKADTIKTKFDKIAHTYPYLGDIESERELMEIAKSRGL